MKQLKVGAAEDARARDATAAATEEARAPDTAVAAAAKATSRVVTPMTEVEGA